MLSGYNVTQGRQFSKPCDAPTESVEQQSSGLGGTAKAFCQLSYWLMVLVLGLVSSSAAKAAPAARPSRVEADAMGSTKMEVAKTTQTSSSPLLLRSVDELDKFKGSDLSVTLALESLGRLPESSLLQSENLRAGAAELMHETFSVSVPFPSATLILSTDSTNSEIDLVLPGLSLLEGVWVIDPAPLSTGEGTNADVFSDAAIVQTDLITQATDLVDELPWRVSFEPFIYLPFGANGSITVRDISAPINAGIGDIFSAIVNDLNFAAFGRVEGWKGPWGMFFSGAYMNLGTGRTADIPLPPALHQAGLPPQVSIAAAVGTSFVQLDLGGAYRFGDGNLPTALRTAVTEFDLGPFVFDALAGVRLYSFNNNLVLTSDLGNRFEFDQSQTILEPLIGGRARWNLSNNLAALASASISGFSIGDLSLSVAGYVGIDWLFSGNTSLLASYGFTYLDYSSGNSGLDLFTHGPNLGVKLRF
jgi:hypothetical protein